MKLFTTKCHEQETLLYDVKRFPHKMLTSVAHDQDMQLKLACLVPGISAHLSIYCYCFSTGLNRLFCYIANKLMTRPLGNSEFCFPQISISINIISGNIEILGKQNSLFHSGPVISV